MKVINIRLSYSKLQTLLVVNHIESVEVYPKPTDDDHEMKITMTSGQVIYEYFDDRESALKALEEIKIAIRAKD